MNDRAGECSGLFVDRSTERLHRRMGQPLQPIGAAARRCHVREQHGRDERRGRGWTASAAVDVAFESGRTIGCCGADTARIRSAQGHRTVARDIPGPDRFVGGGLQTMREYDLSNARRRTSSHNNGEGANYVEVADWVRVSSASGTARPRTDPSCCCPRSHGTRSCGQRGSPTEGRTSLPAPASCRTVPRSAELGGPSGEPLEGRYGVGTEDPVDGVGVVPL